LKKTLLLLALFVCGLLLAACGAEERNEPTAAPAATAPEEFRSSDPSLLASTGNPQLVEFYAVW
jgi:ABC-type glycerol-3-phosphate transport system substrate-binding protein